MKYITRLLKAPIAPAFFYFSFTEAAAPHYIETVGVILPMIVAALVGASTAIVIYWRKVRAFFGNRFRRGKGIEKDNDATGN